MGKMGKTTLAKNGIHHHTKSNQPKVTGGAHQVLAKSSHPPTSISDSDCDSDPDPNTHNDEDSETDSSASSREAIVAQMLDKTFTNIRRLESQTDHLWGHKKGQSEGLRLEVVESSEKEDVILELGDVQEQRDCFLLGYFSAPFPGKKALLQLCHSWSDNVRFHVRPNGWIVFNFENEVECKLVLEGCPYFVRGRPLVVKPMPSCFEFDDEVLKYIAVWIQLPGLPIECWSASALSKITSKVGTPLCTDKPTRVKTSISFPRVLVEVDASKELVRSIRIKLPVGKTRVQSVVFEEEPEFCSFCKVIGHAASIECTTIKRNGVGGEIHSKF